MAIHVPCLDGDHDGCLGWKAEDDLCACDCHEELTQQERYDLRRFFEHWVFGEIKRGEV